jgi:hypothetical protein
MENLPGEIWQKVFEYLSWSDIFLRAVRVCRFWRQLINEPLWFYQLYIKHPSTIADEELLGDRYEMIWSKHIPNLFINGGVDPQKLKPTFRQNLQIYLDRILPECHLIDLNRKFAINRIIWHKVSHIVEPLLETLTLPDLDPEEFYEFLKAGLATFDAITYISWLDHMIELYNMPYLLEPLPGFEHLLYKTCCLGTVRNYTDHSLYWQLITKTLSQINPLRAALPFVQKYFCVLDWGPDYLYKIINEEFLRKHPMLYDMLNWPKVCMHVTLSENFIDTEILAKDRKVHANYLVINQRLSTALVKKYRTKFAEMDRGGREAFFIQHEIAFEDIS